LNYWDTNTVIGQPYYYAVTIESSQFGPTFITPFSDKVGGSGQNPDDFIQANSFWNVVTNLSNPGNVAILQTPFSDQYPNQYPGFYYPYPNTLWPSDTTWSNYTTMVIPTNTPLSKVQYSIAIDNYYSLTVNSTLVSTGQDNGLAVWSSFKTFPTNVLHYGTNSVDVEIKDIGAPDYFSMVVTTNTCGY
jgi:hypothetical protein